MSEHSAVGLRGNSGGNWYWVHNALLDTFGELIGPYGIALYSALARRSNNNTQRCVTSYRDLCRLTGISRHQIARELEKLSELALVSVEKRPGRADAYSLLRIGGATQEPVEVDPCHTGTGTGATQEPVEVDPCHTGTAPMPHRNTNKTNKKNNDSDKKAHKTGSSAGAEEPSPPYSASQLFYLDKMDSKRFKTRAEGKAVLALEHEVGLDAFQRAVLWAAENGIRRFSSIQTAARKIAKNGERRPWDEDGRRSRPSGRPSNFEETQANIAALADEWGVKYDRS